jgi:hypothetical protein
MSEEEFAIILAEIKQLRNGIAEAVKQIVHQEGEIEALQCLIEQKGLATADELSVAGDKGARLIHAFLQESDDDSSRTPSHPVQNGLRIARSAGARNEPRNRTQRNCRRRVKAKR